jgi:hypothetical protein
MRVKPVVFGAVVVLVFMGIIWGFQAAGIWSISGKVNASGEQVNPSASDVNTIKGWMTLKQISEVYAVPVDELLLQFSIPADSSPETAIKDLESEVFEVSLLREWLEAKMNGGQPTVATEQAEVHIPVQQTETVPASTPDLAQTPAESHIPPISTITGKTTFQDLIDWGLDPAVIEQVIGSPIPAGDIIVKDHITSLGLEFSPLKTELQAELDKIN